MPQPLRILIVEDEPAWAKAIKSNLLEIFNDLGLPCTIEVPETIRECKAAIRSCDGNPYDLISLDINFREDDAEEHIDGLKLLGIISQYKAAWLVSILTGVESDGSVGDTYGEERARQLQGELRALAYQSFPPERLLVLDKPDLDDAERLERQVRQICLVLRQSLVGRNLFRPMELPCQVAIHETIHGDWIKRDSDVFRRARKAMDFVKEYEKAQDAEKKLYEPDIEMERKLDILLKVGPTKKLKNAKWVDDAVSLRQVRFGCSEIITLTDSPHFETIAWLLEHPWEDFAAHEIGGDAPDVGKLSVDFKYPHDDEELGNVEFEDDESLDHDRRGEDRDFDQDSGDTPEEWDCHEAESHSAYFRELKRKEAELENATGRRRAMLEEEIGALEKVLEAVQKKAVSGKTRGLIKQHKSRTIAALKEAGQVELARHLEQTIRIQDKISYIIEPSSIFWNVH